MNVLHRLRVIRLGLPGNSPQDNGTKQKRNLKKKKKLETYLHDAGYLSLSMEKKTGKEKGKQ